MLQPTMSGYHRNATRRTAAPGCLERLEARCLLSGSLTAFSDTDVIEMDPELLAKLDTPKVRRPGANVPIEQAGVLPGIGSSVPATSTGWDAVSFDSGAATTGSYFIPPDTNGAAGPTHVVDVVNSTIQWYTKAGVLDGEMRLGRNASTATGSFFAALSPATPLFDPKVVYDQYNGRFVVVALEQQDTFTGDPVNSSRILVAVSDDSNPNGTWHYQAIDSNITFHGTKRWCDYPGLATDASAIYITGNMFGYGAGNFAGSRLWIIGKTGLYSGGTSTVSIYDPSSLAGLRGEAFTLQPAQMYGSAPGSTGTFLVSSGWSSGSNELINVIRVDNPLTAPSFSDTFVNVGDISSTFSPSAAPQPLTTSTIDSGDGRIYNAVWRNDNLYFANTISPGSGVDAAAATAHWYRFTADEFTISLADQGNVGGEDIATGTSTYYPAVTVDAAGDMAIGFSASGPDLYAGAYYTGRLATDAPGTVQTSWTLAAGQDYYVRTFGTRNRWGDYSGMSLDPANESSFWVFNQYAQTRGTAFSGEDGRWGTRWGTFSFVMTPTTPDAPALSPSYDTGISASDGITRYNNASADTRLLFTVTNTTAGSTVRIYADGALIGSASASGPSTAVLADGTTLLADGAHTITARQYNGSSESPDSAPLPTTIDAALPAISGFTVNDGTLQRSMVKSLALSFSEPVSSSGAIALLTHSGAAVPDVVVNYAWSADAKAVTMTFAGSAIIGASLSDGIYDLVTTASLLSDVAGNTLTANDTRTFHRLFGDSDGNKVVNALDYARLKNTFARVPSDSLFNSAFDYEGNNLINALDLARFRQRYGMVFSY